MTLPALRWGMLLMAAAAAALGAVPEPVVRVEAHSGDLLAVGTVRDRRMSIHLSRPIDNAPVHDAVVTVLLRGATHPTIAEADGSYSFVSPDLALPGNALLVFQVAREDTTEQLRGTMAIVAASQPEVKNSARQLGWWVLNFGVCTGFLLLIARRRKSAAAQD